MAFRNALRGVLRGTRPGLLIGCVLALSASAAAAQDAAPEQLRLFLEKETSGVAGRVEVSVGNLDARVHLAACARMQPFVPGGARLWGRTTLGVRCVEGANWQVYLPVQIRVYGEAPVATRPLAAGESPAGSDLRMEEIELTRYPIGAIADPARLAGLELARPVGASQPLMRNQFRVRQILASGDMVKLTYTGQSFAVSTQARALASACDGQSVRVVTDSGKTVTGTARPGRVVELKF